MKDCANTNVKKYLTDIFQHLSKTSLIPPANSISQYNTLMIKDLSTPPWSAHTLHMLFLWVTD